MCRWFRKQRCKRIIINMHVLITRQIDQSKKFSNILNNLNIKNTVFPVICIKKIKPEKKYIDNIKNADFIIFTSQNSVTALIENLQISDLNEKKIAAIGKSTKELLCNFGIKVDICPKSEFTSEGLLKEIKNNNIRNKKIVIIKGLGGRKYLQDHLSQDNYLYEDINVYSRNFPEKLSLNLNDLVKDITHICITSVDILNYFKKIVDIQEVSDLKNIVFISGNEKIANKIKADFPKNEILVSLNPTNEAMLKTIT